MPHLAGLATWSRFKTDALTSRWPRSARRVWCASTPTSSRRLRWRTPRSCWLTSCCTWPSTRTAGRATPTRSWSTSPTTTSSTTCSARRWAADVPLGGLVRRGARERVAGRAGRRAVEARPGRPAERAGPPARRGGRASPAAAGEIADSARRSRRPACCRRRSRRRSAAAARLAATPARRPDPAGRTRPRWSRKSRRSNGRGSREEVRKAAAKAVSLGALRAEDGRAQQGQPAQDPRARRDAR